MAAHDVTALLTLAERGINDYLEQARSGGRIDEGSYQQAKKNAFPNLKQWLTDPAIQEKFPTLRPGLAEVIGQGRWEELVNAFRQAIRFGTGGIRGMMAFDRASIARLAAEGITAPILKGTTTINDFVLLLTSAGVAQFGKEQNPKFDRVVIGYDSRVRGQDFARAVAEVFLAYGYTVYFFDEPCPYPEMTFAIPCPDIQADIGILISASHNDYRYNGYKLSCSNGSQFDPKQRDEMYKKYIAPATVKDIKRTPFEQAAPGKLVFLGGSEPVAGFEYYGREQQILNLHEQHCRHAQSFLLTPDIAAQQRNSKNPLKIGFCAFHGAGRRAVPRLLTEVGFPAENIEIITEGGLNDLNGLFPSFCSDPGKEQQPDPGDIRAGRTAIAALKKQLEKQPEHWQFVDMDLMIGTDPDADRCGVIVKIPVDQRHLYSGEDWILLPADALWALVVWYRLHRSAEKHGGTVQDADKMFVVLSHTTSDSITLLARKYGLGVIKTWVGFASLSAAVRDVWDGKTYPPLVEGRESNKADLCHPFVLECLGMDNGKREFNLAAMEQSNGFSILGGPPKDARSLGTGGHVRDKDGTLAALLVAEIAAWAKEQGTTLFELIDKHINSDPEIGLFINHYEPDPIDGEYPGIEGDRKKIEILRRALGYYQLGIVGDLSIGGRKVTGGTIYRTGKYDAIYEPTFDFRFPDEGVRLYLGSPLSHVTIRPSGTGNSLRFHIQLHEPNPGAQLIEKKGELLRQAQAIADELRTILKAPR